MQQSGIWTAGEGGTCRPVSNTNNLGSGMSPQFASKQEDNSSCVSIKNKIAQIDRIKINVANFGVVVGARGE